MTRFAELRGRVGEGWSAFRPDRRTLLIGGGGALGLGIAWAIWPRALDAQINAAANEHVFGPYLKIGTDGHITVIVPQTEMGQGAYTLIAQMAADELGADWRTIAVEPAPLAGVYANHQSLDRDAALATPRFAVPDAIAAWGSWRSFAVGSGASAMVTDTAMAPGDFEQPVRECAAIARAMLCMAAADRWNAEWEACGTANGFVEWNGQRLRFAELAAAAAEHDPPSYPPLRAPGSGALVGQSAPRLDLPSKVDGSFAFAADIRLPDMVYAVVRHGPVGDTILKSYDRRGGDAVPGFVAAVRHERWLAAVAQNSWAASRALDAMAPVFSTRGQRAESAVADRRLKAALADPDGVRLAEAGDVVEAMRGRPVLSSDYQIAPMLHAMVEPPAATATFDGGRLLLWAGSQAPGLCRAAVATAMGMAEGDITLFAMPLGGNAGGGYDHRAAIQAALVARAVQRPVQLSWTRTEDLLQDLPRPPMRARMSASLSSGATIDSWHASIAVPAWRHQWRAQLSGGRPDAAASDASGRADAAAVAGAVPPYQIPHLAIDHLPVDCTYAVGRARGDAYAMTNFLTECFVDELARAAGSDPLSFRMAMLGQAPELARVLQLVAELGGWDGGRAGSGHGLACASVDGSHIAIMAEARPGAQGLVVERLVAVADVGTVLNPGLTRQQIEGGMVFGLAAGVGATTRYRRGLGGARRLRDIGLPVLAQMPRISVELVPSNQPSGGFGQIGCVPVAAAIANALFTVTGERIRRLPLSTKPLP